jgi:hypothetical protein
LFSSIPFFIEAFNVSIDTFFISASSCIFCLQQSCPVS